MRQRLSFDDSFPYTDTLKVLSKWGPGSHFFGIGGAEDIPKLEEYLETLPEGEGRTLALFCEFPGNPLLKSPDLLAIRKLADQYGFVIVVDETIGNFINVEVASVADIVVSSLTKIFSGDANVMGGWCVQCLSLRSNVLIPQPHSQHERSALRCSPLRSRRRLRGQLLSRGRGVSRAKLAGLPQQNQARQR